MRIIMGLDASNAGDVTVNGRHYHDLPWPLHEVGALLEAKAIHPGRTARKHLLMLAQANRIARTRVDEVLEVVGLSSVANQRAGKFSLGMGQRLGLFGALVAVWLRSYPYDIYTQIGIVTLIGLAAKNAILIVEFARQRYEDGQSIRDAAMEAARLRLRPILMTSFAFILGVTPLLMATGAGGASRRSLGTAVFGGMNAATLLAIFIVPVLFVVIQRIVSRKEQAK